MAKYNVHAGHNKKVPGASKYLNEVTENRKVKDYLIKYLKDAGNTVYDCTDDVGNTQNANLQNIVAKCNNHDVTLDISIHLNAGGGTGVEVYNYDERTKTVSDKICSNISKALGISNRGTKYSKSLYVLNNTESPAILIECCFVDSKTDAEKWNATKCAKAIAEGVLGQSISDTSSSTSSSTSSNTSTSSSKSIEVLYRAYAGKWYSNVSSFTTSGTNSYAGVKGKALTALQANTVGDADVVGKLKYRLRKLNGGYYNWQTDREADSNGENFAGDQKNKFDRLQMTLEDVDGYKVKYRAYDSKHGWLDWVTGYNTKNSNGYAGYDGYAIECVQIKIVKV